MLPRKILGDYFLLKNCTARSCFCAAARVLKVPRFLLLPVFGSFLREYKRNCPDFSFLIMSFPPLLKRRIEILILPPPAAILETIGLARLAGNWHSARWDLARPK